MDVTITRTDNTARQRFRLRQLSRYTVLVLFPFYGSIARSAIAIVINAPSDFNRYHLADIEGCLSPLRLRLAGMTVATLFLFSVCILTLVFLDESYIDIRCRHPLSRPTLVTESRTSYISI